MSANGKEYEISKLKEAASLLTKGGTLINEPCSRCHGVQVKFKDKIICINCGNEENTIDGRVLKHHQQEDKHEEKQRRQEEEQQEQQQEQQPRNQQLTQSDINTNYTNSNVLRSFRSNQEFAGEGHLNFAKILIEEKIYSLMEQIKYEEEVDILKQKVELVGKFLELLQKIKNMENNKEN
jgi:uncharacterized Zn finger protein (UPF0148 family)